MAGLDAFYIPELTYPELLGLESRFLEAVAAGCRAPALITYTLTGRLVSLGRYHFYDGPEERGGVGAYRRLTGGRIVGGGQGWLGCALIIPSRDSLLPRQSAGSLKPDQIINRCVRGVLTGLGDLGLDCFYPGRDAITVKRRELAICSFETDSSGALLFETILAVNRGLEEMVHDLERLDPDGALTCPMYDPDRTTTIARELGREVAGGDLASAIEAGYAPLFGDVRHRELTSADRLEARERGAALAASGWLTSRHRDPFLGMVGREAIQLGFAEAHLALNAGGEIERLTMAGDFIANSGGLAEFERELQGKRLDLMNVSAAAAKIYGDGGNYILGFGDLANLCRVIMKAS